jgi:hypothetical protein
MGPWWIGLLAFSTSNPVGVDDEERRQGIRVFAVYKQIGNDFAENEVAQATALVVVKEERVRQLPADELHQLLVRLEQIRANDQAI